MDDGRRRQRKETVVSVVRPLPDRPNLTNLRKQAKSLLAAWRAGDEPTLTRIRELHPRGAGLAASGRHSLADAQLVVARGYGFPSWAKLVQHLRLTPRAQALHSIDRLFATTLAPAGEPVPLGSVLDRRVEVVWQAYLDRQPAAAELLRAVGAGPALDRANDGGLTYADMR